MQTMQQLQAEYLANGGVIKIYEAVEPVIEPTTKKLKPTESPQQFDGFGRRVYQNLNQFSYRTEVDETKYNYGRTK